ncbi:RagB/SusD family nutrient uptake outer membrane protein [Saprospiraceae bacterium]|nr:RagB/SusD family nutrient uptake outer membrane protein [Saprospiraceae bacterium]
MKSIYIKIVALAVIFTSSCTQDWLELQPRGQLLETNFYQNEEQIFQGLVAAYDVLNWGGTEGWTMKLGLLNAASDDTYAGGSDASDQPSWVAYDAFTLDPFLGPQKGLWNKGYTGIYRANLVLQKLDEVEGLSEEFIARTSAEAKFLRAFYYFDLVRFFENIPLINTVLSADAIYEQVQADPALVYARIELDLREAINTIELPQTVPANELGRVTQGAAKALLGKVILFQNDQSRMGECAVILEEVINSLIYDLEVDYANIFSNDNEYGIESVFEISNSGAARAGWESFANGSEGNYNVQFFGMRDYVGPDYATGWSFCPVTEDLNDFLISDPRYLHTIIDATNIQGASFTPAYQNTNLFIKKYAPVASEQALDGEVALNWSKNIREIRFADVLLMAAEARVRNGEDSEGRVYLNRVRQRVSLQPVTGLSGDALLNFIYDERRRELATEGHRFFDLVRTRQASDVLPNFQAGKHERLPIPQFEIDITEGNLKQNSGY